MTIYAIIPAAGSGSRAGFRENKLLRRVGGAPVFFSSLPAARQNGAARVSLREKQPFPGVRRGFFPLSAHFERR